MAADDRERAAFRRWARENHPDVGGDPDVFAAGVRALREGRWAEFTGAELAAQRTTVYVNRTPRGLAGMVAKAKRLIRRRQPPRVK
jgi:hypothetical protein